MEDIFRLQSETMGLICQNGIIINYLQKSCRAKKKKVLNSLAGIMVSVVTRINELKHSILFLFCTLARTYSTTFIN